MRVLITSGGTSVPIDNVRSIKNFSSGSFGCKLAKHLLLNGHKVTHLYAVDAPTPFEFKVDLLKPHQDYISQLDALQEFSKNYMKNYIEEKFSTFDSYRFKVNILLDNFEYDSILLCAAVSDYGTSYYDGKISSILSYGNVEPLQLYPLPKVIKEVRKKHKGILIGFKLLSNVTENELHNAAWKQIDESGSDIVIANILEDIQFSDNKQMWIVKPEYSIRLNDSSNNCARMITEMIKL